MTVQELEQQLKKFQDDFDTTRKEFQLKLDNAEKDASKWKKISEDKESETRKFQEEAEKAKKERELALAEARKREVKDFFDRMKKEERITPAQEEMAARLAESMTSETEIATFGEKDGKKVSHTQLSLFKELVASMPKRPRTATLTPGGSFSPPTPEGTGEGGTDYQEVWYGGQKVLAQVDDMDLHVKALEYQEAQRAKNVTVSYEDALIEAGRRQAAGA